MLDRLKSILRSDDLISSLSVFPEIDEQKLARDLDLERIGKQRGTDNQPREDATEPDSVETKIIDRIGSLRRIGLENFENNRRTYNERLARAGEFRKEVDIIAGKAKGDFTSAVHGWKATMTRSIERLRETYAHREHFRVKHKLQRPAKQFQGWFLFAAITVIFIVIESGMNAVMFSRGNEQGLLGGLLTATIFSALNVIVSTMLGYFACGLNHRSIFRKILGFGALSIWVVFTLSLNLMIAHFRDLIDEGVAWAEAIKGAVPALEAGMLALTSMDSWILIGIGLTISILAFIKGWHATDPFPGYAGIEIELKNARDAHENDLQDAVAELTEKRDDAIDELRDADRQVREGISDAVDALFGQSALNAHLLAFLDQCDTKLAYLLALYRDANRGARTEVEPKSFAEKHNFTAYVPSQTDDGRRKIAEDEADRIGETVDKAIQRIFTTYDEAIREFRLPEEIQRGEQPQVAL